MKNLKTLQNLILSISTLVFLSISNSAYAASHEFITTWKTDADGENIIIPTHSGSTLTYGYTIDCGTGGLISGVQTAAGQNGDATCNYATAGTYEIRISGTFPRIYLHNDAVSKDKLITVEQWGTVGWTSMDSAFYGATGLTSVPNNTTGLASVENMLSMFAATTVFNADISNWDVSAVSSMENMFYFASAFNQDISGWDVGAVNNMSFMFSSATAFNQNIGNWDVSAVTNMSSMFFGATAFNQNLGQWYIVPASDTIANTVGASLEINAQNTYLDGHSPVYAITGGADAGKFTLSSNYTELHHNLIGGVDASQSTLSSNDTGSHHNLTSSADAGKSTLSSNTLTLTAPDSAATAYTLIISSIGGNLFGTENQRILTISLNPNTPPTIAGTPLTSIAENSFYSFTPTATDADNDNLTFSIDNKPSWASFDTATGALTGTPSNRDFGVHSNIIISVSDGALMASLTAFDINVISGFNLDIDGNGRLGAFTDGFLIIRFMGEQSFIDTTGAVAPDRTRSDEEILEYLQNNAGKLDIDGSGGSLNIATDGLLIIRFMFGQSDVDTTNAVLPDRTNSRSDDEILEYLQSLAP